MSAGAPAQSASGWLVTGVFVTGTDTGVGKTVAACALLRALSARGLRAVGMKPVASGIAAGAACNDDVARLAAAGNVEAPLETRNPYAFAPAIAPHLAAREAGVAIDLARIEAAYRDLARRADRVIVEGAGGALAPLDDERDMLDIARIIALPVLLVVGVRLGCLNHALLTALAIRARGLDLVGWIANTIEPELPRLVENLETLDRRLAAPRVATLAWSAAAAPAWNGPAGI